MVNAPHTRHLLVVDDEVDSADALAELLQFVLPQWDVAVAYGSLAAVECTRHNPFEIVVLDIEMPGLDGFETAAALRAVTQGALPVTIAVSGSPSKVVAARASGIFDFSLLKPIDVEQIKAVCEPLLRLQA